jgi:tRNA(adenine34) deaminase
VKDGVLLGAGHNTPIASHDATAHAEINALRAACQASANYRLDGATIYVTLEPCAMCAGALVNARLSRLVFGARDLRFGGAGSKFQIADSELLNHRLEITEGVMGAECLEMLQRFFAARR